MALISLPHRNHDYAHAHTRTHMSNPYVKSLEKQAAQNACDKFSQAWNLGREQMARKDAEDRRRIEEEQRRRREEQQRREEEQRRRREEAQRGAADQTRMLVENQRQIRYNILHGREVNAPVHPPMDF